MSAISWNCRGMGRPRTVRALRDLVRSENPSFLGLIETKVNSREWDYLRFKLGFNYCFAVDCSGRSGGLALLWNPNLNLTIQSYSKYHIDAIVKTDKKIRVTLFYGHPRVDRRKESWDLLKKLNSLDSMPWAVLGDFNEILFPEEMNGIRSRQQF